MSTFDLDKGEVNTVDAITFKTGVDAYAGKVNIIKTHPQVIEIHSEITDEVYSLNLKDIDKYIKALEKAKELWLLESVKSIAGCPPTEGGDNE